MSCSVYESSAATADALVHALRHTYTTELANTNISVHTLMKLLGHDSTRTSQRYVNAAGAGTRAAAAKDPLYRLTADRH
ncbi:tyrosine-type recombinase/integrase [Mycobacterium sp. TY815]|uniref:tyrosine-type recombinase/integrase n=1 Tax=Mycobacterium sp. TY815 TaxID=3050581 RepID=UPI0027414B95|nr:tyrosine-type recombinase/integrase [Mycobacterium sp. TY815]